MRFLRNNFRIFFQLGLTIVFRFFFTNFQKLLQISLLYMYKM